MMKQGQAQEQKPEQEEIQEKQQFRNFKGSHKDFYRWMTNEIDDFFPEIVSEDPLKRFYHLLDPNYSTRLSKADSQNLVQKKHRKAPKTLKHGPNFSISKYWQEFSSELTENVLRFLDLKDMIMLVYTCKYFRETLDKESIWKFLQIRDFSSLRLKMLRDDTKYRVSEKLYYKYLFLSIISGIPYHTGYFKTYGSPDVVELSEFIVDVLHPKRQVMKNYVGEILVRNQCKTFDLKLSWLKEKNEICLWNGNSSLEFQTPEVGNDVNTVNKFYPCFIKRYSMIDEDEEVSEIFFLEDKYLVVKLFKKLEADKIIIIFRILNLEEELYSIAKGLESAVPFDYSFVIDCEEKGKLAADIATDEFGVHFTIYQEKEYDMKLNLFSGDKAVFYTENSVKPTMIFWDLKEKKKIDVVYLGLQKPLSSIIMSKKSDAKKIKLFILDEYMNVYCASLSEKEGFILNQTIILPIAKEEETEEVEKPQEFDLEKFKELEAKYNLSFGKKTRSKYQVRFYSNQILPVDSIYDLKRPFESQKNEKNRSYHHEIWSKTKEEWLIVCKRNSLHFINLDEGKIHEFSPDKEISLGNNTNWHIYEDNLVITNPTDILYSKISFENHRLYFRFSRQIEKLAVEKIMQEWIVFDPCFTVLAFTHGYQLGYITKMTIIFTSTQEFLYNQDPNFNLITYKVQADQLFNGPNGLNALDRDFKIQFENSKVLIKTKKASFYFDMNLSAQPYNKVYLNGWMSNNPIHTIRTANVVAPEVKVEEEEIEKPKQKMVNNMKLKGNPNTMNAKEKSNGWKNGGKSQAKKDEDKEYKVLKSKGDKFHKNIRQGQRSDKIN